MAKTVGRQEDIKQFYEMFTGLLAARGIFPLYRASGLRPHVTLGYKPRRFEALPIAVEWLPHELLLVESHVGDGRHQVVDRWPLLPPPQGTLPFEMPIESVGSVRASRV